MTRPSLALIGAGRVGATLALAAHRAGYRIAAVHTRTPGRASQLVEETGAQVEPDIPALIHSAAVILIAVPDDAIGEIDKKGAEAWRPETSVVHHSGLHSAAILRHAAAAGAKTGTLHPLQTIPDARTGPERLKNAFFGISGHVDLLPVLHALVHDLGGHPLVIPDEAKPLYHAAAVFASNYITACFAQAVGILADLGIAAEDAAAALLPLARGAVDNLADPGLPHALTGPLTRGDSGTLTIHQQHLAARRPDLLPLYRQLAQAALPLAAAQGKLSPEQLDALGATLKTRTLSGTEETLRAPRK